MSKNCVIQKIDSYSKFDKIRSTKRKILAFMIAVSLTTSMTGCVFGKSAKEMATRSKYDFSESDLNPDRKKRDKEVPMGEEGTWTTFVYLCGSDLESNCGFASKDMQEMIDSSANDNTRFVVQTGGSLEWKNSVDPKKLQRYVIENGTATLVDVQPIASMGDANTLTSFLKWGIEKYPAANIGLVLWDHGGGSIQGACLDELTGIESDRLFIREIDAALYNIFDDMTDKFAFIGFDACLMATVEVAALLASHADYLIASEETEPGYGWDYTAIGNYLSEHPKADGAEIGTVICDSFYDSCSAIGQEESVTISVTDLSKIDILLKGFDLYAKDIYELSESNDAISPIVREVSSGDIFGTNSRRSGYTNMIDLKDLIEAGSAYSDISADLLEALSDTVVYRINGSMHESACGLSIYYPIGFLSQAQGEEELSIFQDVCISSYYFGFVDKLAYGAMHSTISGYDNTEMLTLLLLLYGTSAYQSSGGSYHYSPNTNHSWDFNNYTGSNSSAIHFLHKPHVDADGHFSFQIEPAEAPNIDYVQASVYLYQEDTKLVYELGDTGNVVVDHESGEVHDDFDGKWFALPDGQLLSAYLIERLDDYDLYYAPILCNDIQTNLRFRYNRTTGKAEMVCICANTGTSGQAARSQPIMDGDKLTPIYYQYHENLSNQECYTGKAYTYDSDNALRFEKIPKGEYWFSFRIYDIFGNSFETDTVTFTMAEETVTFVEQEHRWVEATCIKAKYCLLCGEIEGAPLGHAWEKATCENPKQCKQCDLTMGEPLGHDWSNATYTEPMTCRLCGKTEGEPLDFGALSAVDLMSISESEFQAAAGDVYRVGPFSEMSCIDGGLSSSKLPGFKIVYGDSGYPAQIFVESGKVTDNLSINSSTTIGDVIRTIGLPDKWFYSMSQGSVNASYRISGIDVFFRIDDTETIDYFVNLIYPNGIDPYAPATISGYEFTEYNSSAKFLTYVGIFT